MAMAISAAVARTSIGMCLRRICMVEPPVDGRAPARPDKEVRPDYRHTRLGAKRALHCARREASEGVMWSGPPVLPRRLGQQGISVPRVRPVTLQNSAQ